MTKLRFYPLGNADTTLIELKNNRFILWDYANMKCENDINDKRIDLPTSLNKVVNGDYEVVAFSHADRDHINRFSEYFYLEYAIKYQTEGRKKIKDLWVPATVILETNLDNEEAKILRCEARHRLKNGKGIRVFSKPDALKGYLSDNGIDFNSVEHLIVDAGTSVPGWGRNTDGVEFFAHAPFSASFNHKCINRNDAGIVVQATFGNTKESKFILGADATWGVWNDIVDVTKYYGNEAKLEWDIFHISHHTSYLSLNIERGDIKTTPTEQIKWLFETQGHQKGIMVSPSWEIPNELGTTQPPHKEAANYYRSVASNISGEYKVTMEHPSKGKPDVLEIQIDDFGIKLIKATIAGTSFVSNSPTPRAG